MPLSLRSGADLFGNRLTGLANGSSATDAATYGQLQSLVAGLSWHPSVRLATTANQTLSGLSAIDGVTPNAGDRVLVKNQSTASANGIYIAASGAWALAQDSTQGNLLSGAAVIVDEGSTQADTLWLLTTDGTITIGTTALTFTKFAAGVTYSAGNGISISSGSIAVNADGTSIIADGTSVRVNPTYAGLAKRYAATLSASQTAVTHNLGTTDATVIIQDISGTYPVLVSADVTYTSANQVTLGFSTAPAANQYRVIVLA